MSIKSKLKNIIFNSMSKINSHIDINLINIEISVNPEHGDYSSNIALVLTRTLKDSPMNIGKRIVENISDNIIDHVEIAAPGFINIYLKHEYLLREINNIINANNNYGKNNHGNGKKINIEYVSANPTGTLHIGHGRGAVYGDNLSRILNYCGYNVTREYYINDAGNQMNNLGISIKERYKEQCHLESNLPEDGYHGKEIIELANKLYIEFQDTLLNQDTSYFKQIGLEYLLKAIKQDLDKLRVNFDVFTSEQTLYDTGEVERVLTTLEKSQKCYVNEDALWLKTTEYGDEKDRVIVKKDGNYTYLLPDIAYHVNKYSRGYDELIDVLGADHHGYINRLKASLTILGYNPDILEVHLLQMVRLIKDGEEIKISKRTGKAISLNELVNDVGVNATRYFFSSKSLDTQMDFDLDLATKNSNDNPVFYIEYANARITSILNTYHQPITPKDKYTKINEDIAYTIINKLLAFEDVIINASIKKSPHIICNYVYELSTLFHSYYSECKFISSDIQFTEEHLLLLKAIKIVINNSLNLLGIIPREQM